MNIEVITSFDQHYYDIIGKDSVTSWLEHWPADMTLTAYVEEFSIPDQARVHQIGFDQLPAGYRQFQDLSHKSRVHTFAKKAWCLIHAMHTSAAHRIMWIDADVITVQPVDHALLAKIMPDQVLSTHLAVRYSHDGAGNPGSWLVPETGIFVVNTQHALFSQFRAEYQRRYVENDRSGLRRFYDNDVYGAALDHVDPPVLDLCANLKKPYKTPLKHTVLGPYLHHYKAKHSKDWFVQARDQ
jgi:hypothetical protein